MTMLKECFANIQQSLSILTTVSKINTNLWAENGYVNFIVLYLYRQKCIICITWRHKLKNFSSQNQI